MGHMSLQEMLDNKQAELKATLFSRQKLVSALNELTVVQLKLEASIEMIETIIKEQAPEANNA